ncbi:hypothetical protein C5167_008669 [Papaver somniferum]|uniref:Uncharacterized protein n=1 Tax=Papaver somniferum TaxID=3469 RepID=A0A4Y7JZ58_PAPSO|nr:hypothetical protein C5167_008669 [Papaver somniferum]
MVESQKVNSISVGVVKDNDGSSDCVEFPFNETSKTDVKNFTWINQIEIDRIASTLDNGRVARTAWQLFSKKSSYLGLNLTGSVFDRGRGFDPMGSGKFTQDLNNKHGFESDPLFYDSVQWVLAKTGKILLLGTAWVAPILLGAPVSCVPVWTQPHILGHT